MKFFTSEPMTGDVSNEELVEMWRQAGSVEEKDGLLMVICARIRGITKRAAGDFSNLRLLDFDERVQLLESGLPKLLNNIDIVKGKLSTLCYYHFRKVLTNEYRREMAQMRNPEGGCISIDALMERYDDTSCASFAKYTDAGFFEVEDNDFIQSVRLTDAERTVCSMLMDNYQQNEIAARLGVSPTRVRQHVAKLREKFSAADPALRR